MNRPVQQLIAERLPITARMIAVGGGIGLLAGFLAAAFTAGRRSRSLETVLAPANGLLLSAPPAVVALLFLWFNLDPALAIAVAVCPYVFRYAQKLLAECAAGLHVLTARAHGLSEARIFAAYILFPALAQLAAIAGITATVAFGAAIPVEVICDRPGLGQLAWQAAIGRDMPVLVTVTVLITIVIVAVNAVSEIAVAASPQARLAESK